MNHPDNQKFMEIKNKMLGGGNVIKKFWPKMIILLSEFL